MSSHSGALSSYACVCNQAFAYMFLCLSIYFCFFLSLPPSGYFLFFIFPSLYESAFSSFSSLSFCECEREHVCLCVCVHTGCLSVPVFVVQRITECLSLSPAHAFHPTFAADSSTGVWETQAWGPQVLRRISQSWQAGCSQLILRKEHVANPRGTRVTLPSVVGKIQDPEPENQSTVLPLPLPV